MTHDMQKALDDEQGRRPDIRPSPIRTTREIGTSGTAIYAGNIVPVERDSTLTGAEKYRVFGEMLANVTILGAGVRFFLNLVSAAKWKVEPAKEGGEAAKELAERVQDMLDNLDTSWHRIVRKAAMYKFYGFSVLEWIMRRADDGTFELADVENRPQVTITRWDTDASGKVIGILQTSPQTHIEVNIPREKVVYLVDDSLSDSPEGLGLFRHVVEACKRLRKYEQLEGFGYEGNLKGIPLLRAPLMQLLKEVQNGTLKKEDMEALLAPFKSLMQNHAKNPTLAIMVDSEVYTSQDAVKTPSGAKQWDVELMDGGDYSLAEVAKAIERIVMEIARVLGVEHLLLGGGSGSYALSKDKSNNFGLIVDSALKELREQFEKDLLGPLWLLNGWDEALKPKLVTDTNVTRDIEQLSAVIRDLSAAGVVLDREDEAVAELFNLLGLPRLIGQVTDPDAQLTNPDGTPAADGAMPEDDPEDPEDDSADPEDVSKAERTYVREPAGSATGGQFASTRGGGGGGAAGQEPKTAAQVLQQAVLDKGGTVRPGSFNEKGERTMEVIGDKGTVMVTVNRAGEILTSDVAGNKNQKKMHQFIMRAAFKKPN